MTPCPRTELLSTKMLKLSKKYTLDSKESPQKKKKKKRTREEENDNKINQVGLIDLQLYLLPSGDTLWVEVRAKVGSSRTG